MANGVDQRHFSREYKRAATALLAICACQGCATSGDKPAAMQIAFSDARFRSADRMIVSFAVLDDKGNMAIVPNRAFAPYIGAERFPPTSTGYRFYRSALGGIAPGEVKPIRQAAGQVILEDDHHISISYYSAVPDIALPPPARIGPTEPGYQAALEAYHLKEPGDGFLIPLPAKP
ncbi:hypothetical protein U1839_02190 [Sphingomonas sp. RT2P30]|uniref:hypothetical protein n=1 Tax=Parasphingomonas halimpatiens TaxID=3096162 RepID=UPI002FCA72BF